MKVDGGFGSDLAKVPEAAKELEAAGYSGAWTAETAHDPFFPFSWAPNTPRHWKWAHRLRLRSHVTR